VEENQKIANHGAMKKKWTWLGHTLRINENSIAVQLQHRMPQGYGGKGR